MIVYTDIFQSDLKLQSRGRGFKYSAFYIHASARKTNCMMHFDFLTSTLYLSIRPTFFKPMAY